MTEFVALTFLWLAIALAFGVAEVVTTAFYAIFIVIGALAAAISAQLGAPLPVQVIVFAVVSIAGVVLARPSLLRYLARRRAPELLSGAESMIGQEAPVIDDIEGRHHPGHVRIAGESWPAVSDDGERIPAGSVVKVIALRQATLVVSRVATSPSPAPVEAAPQPKEE
ncbi:MAG: NfeD family protein [Candidatus Dormiibacterota bacterium]